MFCSLGLCQGCHLPVVLMDGMTIFYFPDEDGGKVWHGECRGTVAKQTV